MNDERALKLLEAFSGVEEDLLERCESAVVDSEAHSRENAIDTGNQGKVLSLTEKLRENFKKSSWRYGSAAAAVVCLVIVGLASLSGLRVEMNDSAACEALMEDVSGGAGAFTDAATAEMSQATGLYSTFSGMVESDSTHDVTNGSADNGMVEKIQESSTNAVNRTDDNIAATESEKSVPVLKQESAANEDNIVGCKKYSYIKITEAEAGAHEIFGAYVPTKLPEGYVSEGAYVSGEGEETALMVSWSRGLDSIMVNITQPKKAPATVDIRKTESYDEYLYEIPHAETVPAEYREVFDNPVCAWEDFSLEFVQKRMIVREDAGDTDTPRGNFSVLYPDGVLVNFNGRGTAEEIWTLFTSMKISN